MNWQQPICPPIATGSSLIEVLHASYVASECPQAPDIELVTQLAQHFWHPDSTVDLGAEQWAQYAQLHTLAVRYEPKSGEVGFWEQQHALHVQSLTERMQADNRGFWGRLFDARKSKASYL
jgi:hypothetical protein